MVSTSASYSFTVGGNRTLVANFSINTYAIAATADPIEGGTVSGAGNYEFGVSCTLSATPNESYLFVNWTKDGVEVSTDSRYTFIVTADETYVAHFQFIDNVEENTVFSQIFPNPFTSSVSIKAERTVEKVSVYDIYGRLVKEQTVFDTEFELDLSGLGNGAYLLQLDYGDSRNVHRIVKMTK